MLINHIFEAIHETLATESRDVLVAALNKWTKDVGVPSVDSFFVECRQLQELLNKHYKDGDYKSYDKISEKLSDVRSDAIGKAVEFLHSDNDTVKKLVINLKNTIEESLAALAKNHIEEKLGKIEDWNNSETWEEIRTRRHHRFQNIIVQLRLDAKSREGKTKSGGGDFNKMLDVSKFDPDSEIAKKVDIRNDLGVIINLYSEYKKLYSLVRVLIEQHIIIDFYEEADRSFQDTIDSFLTSILPTYVHEVVHLEQDVRQEIQFKKKWFRTYGATGISYVPNPDKKSKTATQPTGGLVANKAPKGSERKNKNRGQYQGRQFKAGKRGEPDHLGRDAYSANEFTEYLGTAHEIEAHAAGAAAKAIQNAINNDHYAQQWGDKDAVATQIKINEYVDSIINDLKYGYDINDSSGSFSHYISYIKSKIEYLDKKIKVKRDKEGNIDPARTRYPLPKIDALHRKVWRIFITKLIKHLLDHKKPIPWKENDWRREDYPEPTPSKVGNVVRLNKKPNLPESTIIGEITDDVSAMIDPFDDLSDNEF